MPLRRLLLATVLCACSPALAQIPDDLTEPGQFPPSTGFQNPDDISVLLDYRLPDWWSRVWTADADMNGQASSLDHPSGSRQDNHESAFHLDTSFSWNREGERDHAGISATVGGTGEMGRSQVEEIDQRSRTGQASASVQSSWRHYFTNRWSTIVGGGGSWFYREQVVENADVETGEYTRGYAAHAYAGIGFGRIRNVTPVIRAARLNERLNALGYEPLATAEVMRVAEALSRQGAYGRVFARPDRRFWADVLEPVAARADLSPYETFYLAEILQENVGGRFEGWQIDGQMYAGYEHSMFPTTDGEAWVIRPKLNADWSHNLSLDHQLLARAWLGLERRDSPGNYQTRHDAVTADLRLEHLWAVADRVLWTTALRAYRLYDEVEEDAGQRISRNFVASISTSCAVYVEDRLALRPSVSCEYYDLDTEHGMHIHRVINYALTFTYDLDNTLN